VFAAMLAQRGLTGPTPVFEGEHGFFAAVTRGEPYELEPFGGTHGQPFKIAECSIKRFPLGQYSQTVAQAALEVRNQIPNIDVNDIAQVRVRTLQKAIDIMAGDDEKWHPKTRETADHSMPYATAVILKYGALTQHHFDDEYIHDRELLDLVQKVKVEVSEEANRRVPEAMLCDVEVVTRAGRKYSAEVAYHKGHHKNPLTDAEVEDKFRSLAKDLLTPAQTEALLQRLWRLDEAPDVRELMGLMRI